MEVDDPGIAGGIRRLSGLKKPSPGMSWSSKISPDVFQQFFDFSIGVRHEFVSYDGRRLGGVRHSPMSLADGPHPLTLGVGLKDVLAVTLMELVEVLELGGLERQVVGSERDPSTHHHDLSLEVLHHVGEEAIGH